MAGPVKSGDEGDYARATREARREGLWVLAILAGGAAIGLALRWWLR